MLTPIWVLVPLLLMFEALKRRYKYEDKMKEIMDRKKKTKKKNLDLFFWGEGMG